jgi:hypothetical protein
LVPRLVWRVKLVAELRPGEVTETEVARIERDEQAGTADLGLRLSETKQPMAALQDQIVPAQVAMRPGTQRDLRAAFVRRSLGEGGGAKSRLRYGWKPLAARRGEVTPKQGPRRRPA